VITTICGSSLSGRPVEAYYLITTLCGSSLSGKSGEAYYLTATILATIFESSPSGRPD